MLHHIADGRRHREAHGRGQNTRPVGQVYIHVCLSARERVAHRNDWNAVRGCDSQRHCIPVGDARRLKLDGHGVWRPLGKRNIGITGRLCRSWDTRHSGNRQRREPSNEDVPRCTKGKGWICPRGSQEVLGFEPNSSLTPGRRCKASASCSHRTVTTNVSRHNADPAAASGTASASGSRPAGITLTTSIGVYEPRDIDSTRCGDQYRAAAAAAARTTKVRAASTTTAAGAPYEWE